MRRAAFFLLILITLPYRLFHSTYPLLDVHHFRQTQTATVTRNMYLHGVSLWRTELDIFGTGKERYLTLEFPLYEAIVAMLYHVFFVSDIWGRAVSILAGYIGAWYLYQISLFLLKRRTIALLSVFFFLFIPINIFYQRTFLIEPLIIACLLAGMYYFFLWQKHRLPRWYWLSFFLFTAGCLQKGFYGVFWLFPMLVSVGVLRSWRQIVSVPVLAYLMLLLVVMMGWQAHEDQINLASGHGYFTSTNTSQWEWNFGTMSDRLDWEMWQPRLNDLIQGVFTKLGLLLFLIGSVVVGKGKRVLILSAWVLSQVAYYGVLFKIQSHTYYQMVMVPCIALCMAIGLDFLARRCFRYLHIPSAVVVSVTIVWLSFQMWLAALSNFAVDLSWYRQLVALDIALPKQSAGVLLMPTNDWNSVYTYYPNRTMLLIPTTNIPQDAPAGWKRSGYSFLLLYPSRDVLLPVKEKLELEETTDYPGVTRGDFQILRFK